MLQLAAEQALAHVVADGIAARPAEQLLGPRIEFAQDALGVEGDDGVEGQVVATVDHRQQGGRVRIGKRQVGTRFHPALHARTFQLTG